MKSEYTDNYKKHVMSMAIRTYGREINFVSIQHSAAVSRAKRALDNNDRIAYMNAKNDIDRLYAKLTELSNELETINIEYYMEFGFDEDVNAA